MKKYILSIVLTILQLAAVAQTVNVHFKNGQVIEYPSDNIDYINFSAKQSDPSVTSGQVVDLGLSVYWATCNLGSDSPEESGDRYAWGETKTKSEFNQSNYSFYDNNTEQFIDIGNDISGTEYDAATVNLGSDWRMPTVTEMSQLLNDCSWEWTQINGVNGYKVTGKNGNSIFLPTTSGNKNLHYNTSSSHSISDCYCLLKILDGHAPSIYSYSYKDSGCWIRPVTSNLNAGESKIYEIQLGYYNIKSPTFCFKYIYNKKRYSIVKTAPIS